MAGEYSGRSTIDLSKHRLRTICDTPEVTIIDLHVPGDGWMGAVRLVFMPSQIVVTGDLCPARHGVISDLKYGIGWFAGRLGEGYLCEKFLTQRWVPERCAETLRDWAKEDDEEHKDELLRIAEEIDGWVDDYGVEGARSRAYEELGELSQGFVDDGVPGLDYDPHDAGLLAKIQQRFAELYEADHGTAAETLRIMRA